LVHAHAELEQHAERQQGYHPFHGGARLRGSAWMRRQATAVMGEQRLYASCAAAGSALLATDGGTSPAVRDGFSGVLDSGFCVSRPAFVCPEFAQKTVGMGRLHGLFWTNKNPAKPLI